MDTCQPLVTAVVIGAGNRGTVYAQYAREYPEKLQIISVAEPRKLQRERIQNWFNISEEKVFTDWQDVVSRPRFADAAIVATPDALHRQPAEALCQLGYHVLLEKPIATSLSDCESICSAAKEAGVILAICHVMRYLPPVMKLQEMLESGAVGKVAHIQHTENVGYWHFAHSFVRGNWRNTKESTFSLLAKCCHDMDLIYYWIGRENKCIKISSFGSLFHFSKNNKPEGAAPRCLECTVEPDCPYSAVKLYLQSESPQPVWPMSVVCDIEDLSSENYKNALIQQLESGPYGRCVYECDNDVCDNQVVNLEFENGATASLTMVAFTQKLCLRDTKICGTKGELVWDGTAEGNIKYTDFVSGRTESIVPERAPSDSKLSGHGGADYFIMNSFVKAVAFKDSTYIQTGPEESCESHRLVFAAEKSRLTGQVICLQDFTSEHQKSKMCQSKEER